MLGDIAPLKEMVAVSKRHGAMVLVDEAHSMGFFGAQWPRRRPRKQGVDRRCRFRHRHLLQDRRHGRRLLRLQPSQVRNPAAGLPPLCLHRLAAAERRRHRRDLDPQADAWRRTSARISGRTASASTRACATSASRSAPTTPQSAIIAVIMPDLETRRGDVAGAARRGPLRQPRPPAGDARRHVPCCAARSAPSIARSRSAQILAMFERAGRRSAIIG